MTKGNAFGPHQTINLSLWGLTLIATLLLLMVAQAQTWDIFVNNKPFKGQSTGGSSNLMLEAVPLIKMVKLDLRADAQAVTLNGESVPSELKDGVLFVDAKKLAEMCGGKLTVNKEFNSIDVFLAAKPDTKPGPGANNYFSVVSEPGDPVGRGKTVTFNSPDFNFGQDYGPHAVSVIVRAEGQEWVLTFDAGVRGILTPGKTYETLVNKGNIDPSMLVKADGRTAPGWGSFEVLDFANGRVPGRVAINFTLHAEGKPDKKLLTGKLRYQTAVP